jgi:Na+/H+ antiporter NhaD/arsenite permease-like protein
MIVYSGVVIFVVTYVLIAAPRLDWLGLDRPAAALAGAVAMVVAGVLTPAQAQAAVDAPTILLLLGVMGMGAFLAVDGFFERAGVWLAARTGSPGGLLGAVVWGSGGLSALITNDAVCVLGAPVLVSLIQRYRLPPLPYLLALATAANTGSVATLVGNPQNMLCGMLGGLEYGSYALLMAPVAVVGLTMNHAMLAWMFRRELGAAVLETGLAVGSLAVDGRNAGRLTEGDGGVDGLNAPDGAPHVVSGQGWRVRGTFGVIAASAVAYTAGYDLAWASLAGFVVLMFVHRRDTARLWAHVDWSLLLFFGALFVVVEGFTASGAPAWFFERTPLTTDGGWAGWAWLTVLFLVGSNIVSNVPFILVVQDQVAALVPAGAAWELLAMASTFAGNLTLLGSVANIIVASAAQPVGGLTFIAHLRAGAPLALGTTLVGWLWVMTLRGLWG